MSELAFIDGQTSVNALLFFREPARIDSEK